MEKDKNITNYPADLSKTDLFATGYKADFIKTYLESYYSENKGRMNKMIALYGQWGSGKSSVVEYLEKSVDKDKFETVIFEAWKFEKDNNLPLSLLDVIFGQYEEKDNPSLLETIRKFRGVAWEKLQHFSKGVNVSFSTPKYFPNAEINIDLEKISESEEKEKQEERENSSFYKLDKEFKEKFISVEKRILGETQKKLIVFIDDLDRCDPENVLNLLSAIKLFFTYGENIIFFCALDKKAVCQAVKYKYGDSISGEEYIEKIFDINFNMPERNNLKLFLNEYLIKDVSETLFIEEFLHSIEFENPRNMKKVMLKYFSLKEIFNSLRKQRSKIGGQEVAEFSETTMSDHILEYIEVLNYYFSEKTDFKTIFLLFFIIVFEFYRSDFYELLNFAKSIRKEDENGNNFIGNVKKRDSLNDKLLFLQFIFASHINYPKPGNSYGSETLNMTDDYISKMERGGDSIFLKFTRFLLNKKDVVDLNGFKDMVKYEHLKRFADMF
jgi:hypothetical protein